MESLDSIEDQESKLEEGKLEDCIDNEKRLYQGRRRHLLRRDRDASEAKEEEAKEEEKGEETTTRVEEAKDSSLSPLPSRSSDWKNITSNDGNDEEKVARTSMLLTSSSSTYLRKPVEEKLKGKFQRRLLTSADLIPEVHFLGEICKGVGFRGTSISCKWYIEWGESWTLLQGESSGQTQFSTNLLNHPIDLHFASTSMAGWPRLMIQVLRVDRQGRPTLEAYGYTHLPTNPGCTHELEIMCWKPQSQSCTLKERMEELFLGKTPPCLLDEDAVFAKAWENRSQLRTVSSGKVKLNVEVVLRFFHDNAK